AYTTIFGPMSAASGGNRGQTWIVPSSRGGVTQATISLSAASTPEQMLIWIIPLRGLDPNAPIDTGVTHTSLGNTADMATGDSGVMTTVPNEMIFGIFMEDYYSTPYTPESGFTNLSGQEAASLLETRM
ncbi:MAG: hypothetical protein ACRD4Y_00590, partial [Candidatus Acidiferrales bacterium]